jgi:arsenite methyltransferase
MDETRRTEERRTTSATEPCCQAAAVNSKAAGSVVQAEPCCDQSAVAATREEIAADASAEDIRQLVRAKYGEIAQASSPSCCGTSVVENPEALGYTAAQAEAIPAGANLGLGCGSPLKYANVRSGETVLDLGSGAGIDAFLAAREIGANGHVIGVDMTAAMIERARSNARAVGAANVEFRLGEIEHLPVADASVDLVISNCVINLSPDKPQVFREALRVLRPGGRLLVSDLVLLRPLPEDAKRSVEAYVGCVAGASLRDDYVRLVREAGFTGVEIVEESRYAGCDTGTPAELQDFTTAVVSLKLRAWKR